MDKAIAADDTVFSFAYPRVGLPADCGAAWLLPRLVGVKGTVNHYHAVGTCRMGADASAVVDPQLRVRGVDNLRIADASIMPTLINANTCATAFVIGEKAADLIRAG